MNAGDHGPERHDTQQQPDGPAAAEADILIVGHEPRGARRQSASRPALPTAALLVLAALVAAVLVVAGLVGVAAATGSQWRRCPSGTSAQTEIRRLRELTEVALQAQLAPDPKALKELVAADFTQVTPDGAVLNREELISALASGDLDFQILRIHEVAPDSLVEIRVDCDLATVSFRSEMDVISTPLHYRHASRHTDTWAKRDGRWQMIKAQTTAVGGFPPPGH